MTFETQGDFHAFHPFPSDRGDQETANKSGSKCELQSFESRYDWKGEKVVLSVGSRKNLDGPDHVAHESALVLTRFYNREKDLDRTELQIRSPYLKEAFKEVVPEYKEFNIQTKEIVLRDDLRYFFYYRKELQEYGRNLENPTAIEHLMFALTYMYRTLEREFQTYYNFVEVPNGIPSIDFGNLWMVFRPGDYVYFKVCGVEKVMKILHMKQNSAFPTASSSWTLTGEKIAYDGKNFGYANDSLVIRSYNGYKPLMESHIKPLKYHPDKDSIIERFVKRGKRFIGLHEVHHCEYNGTAEILADYRNVTENGEEDEFPLQATTVRGRIMIDGKGFFEAAPSHAPYFMRKTIYTENKEHLSLEDDDYLICQQDVPGFSLVDKKWCFFNVDLIHSVEYNLKAYESLLLDEKYKQMIFSLVNIHTNLGVSHDDVIRGKGKGLVFLLHGVPGVGKTLTAESIADYCKRPLYTISAGDVGTSSFSVELGLGKALRLAEIWNAIILIDEADIFLEQRTTSDLARNGLVSVFLRILEYYQGIMFLTTNRIAVFDDAFKSRIHLAIKYPTLSPNFRKKLWINFLSKTSTGSALNWLDPGSLERLANEDLNGRQIKNIARTAFALALGENSAIKFAHIETALTAIQDFESDFIADGKRLRSETTGDAPGNTSKRRRQE